jgi:transposase
MKMEQESIAMEVVNPQAAGIDVGSRSHWVAVGQSEKDVCEFGVFSQDLFCISRLAKEK